jgi:hypothetical protein
MAVITTGSTVQGLNDGLKSGFNYGAGSPYLVTDTIIRVLGNPNGVVTNNTGSAVAFDTIGQQFYSSRAIGGSTWFKLGSTA